MTLHGKTFDRKRIQHLPVFIALALIAGLAVSSGHAEDKPANAESQDTRIPDGFKPLAKLDDDSQFEELREQRIKLNAAIPAVRRKILDLEAGLPELEAKQSSLEEILKFRETDAKSPELRRLERRVDSLKLQIEKSKRNQEGSTQRSQDLTKSETDLTSQIQVIDGKITALQTDLNAAKDQFKTSRLALDKLEAEQNRNFNNAESAVKAAEALVTRAENSPSATGNNDLAAHRATLAEAQANLAAARNARFEDSYIVARHDFDVQAEKVESLLSEEERLRTEKRNLQDRLINLQSEILSEKDYTRSLEIEIESMNAELKTTETGITRQIEDDQTRDGTVAKLQNDLAAVILEKQTLESQIGGAKSRLHDLTVHQSRVESRINALLVPKTAQDAFKLNVSAWFAALVGIVIVLFFIVTLSDRKVKRMVFSAEAGIQFVTLFSLVIAIILFGITGILEGKELSALLGGISGYILGRVAPPSNKKDDKDDDGDDGPTDERRQILSSRSDPDPDLDQSIIAEGSLEPDSPENR